MESNQGFFRGSTNVGEFSSPMGCMFQGIILPSYVGNTMLTMK